MWNETEPPTKHIWVGVHRRKMHTVHAKYRYQDDRLWQSYNSYVSGESKKHGSAFVDVWNTSQPADTRDGTHMSFHINMKKVGRLLEVMVRMTTNPFWSDHLRNFNDLQLGGSNYTT